jgi:hypothetical protein
MISYKKLINEINIELQSFLENCNYIDDETRIIILNKITKVMTINLGKEEFEKFCNYLNTRNLQLTASNKGNIIHITFYNGFLHIKIKDIIEDYYKFLEGDN